MLLLVHFCITNAQKNITNVYKIICYIFLVHLLGFLVIIGNFLGNFSETIFCQFEFRIKNIVWPWFAHCFGRKVNFLESLEVEWRFVRCKLFDKSQNKKKCFFFFVRICQFSIKNCRKNITNDYKIICYIFYARLWLKLSISCHIFSERFFCWPEKLKILKIKKRKAHWKAEGTFFWALCKRLSIFGHGNFSRNHKIFRTKSFRTKTLL